MCLECNKYPAAYNAEAGVDLNCGWDFDFTASFIYWYVAQDYMDVAFVRPSVSPVGLASTSGAVAYQNFKYKPGFKVGFGFDTGHDGWHGDVLYTWMHQRTTGTHAAPAGVDGWIANDWFTEFVGFFPSVTSKWKMNMDLLDFTFGRPFYQGQCLTILPSGGLRALWLRQNLNITMVGSAPSGFVTLENAVSNNSSHCWSIGPVAGVTSHWMVGSGFRFEGKMGASLLYTRYTTVSHQEQDIPPRQGVTSKLNNMNALRPTFDMGLGLGWGTYFSDNEYFFDLAVRYDFNLFWEQNVMRTWVSNLQGFADPTGDLRMHGLTIDVRFDF